MEISETLLLAVKRKCYVTDESDLTLDRLKDTIAQGLTTVRRLIGVAVDFDFEEEGNEEEYALFKEYCWYAWNDSANEFKENYLDDIISIRQKHEVDQYEEEIV